MLVHRRHTRQPRRQNRQRGFGYLGVLFLVLMTGAGLASVGQVWSFAQQRDREEELLFVGNEFRQALLRYSQHTPAQAPRYPMELEELLRDPRHPVVRRHLRKLYRDPITGSAEWGVVRGPEGRIRGVYSISSAMPIKSNNFYRRDRLFEGSTQYAQWVFGHDLPTSDGRPGNTELTPVVPPPAPQPPLGAWNNSPAPSFGPGIPPTSPNTLKPPGGSSSRWHRYHNRQ